MNINVVASKISLENECETSDFKNTFVQRCTNPFPCSSLLILGYQINLSLVKELHIREKRAILFERVESRARVAESRRCARDIL